MIQRDHVLLQTEDIRQINQEQRLHGNVVLDWNEITKSLCMTKQLEQKHVIVNCVECTILVQKANYPIIFDIIV